jgi:hypothetical protein
VTDGISLRRSGQAEEQRQHDQRRQTMGENVRFHWCFPLVYKAGLQNEIVVSWLCSPVDTIETCMKLISRFRIPIFYFENHDSTIPH